MYYTYLINANKINNNILTFNSHIDYDKLILENCELILDNYFSSFERDFNTIIISKFKPLEQPNLKKNIFFIKFSDIVKASYTINKILNNKILEFTN
jgi:hypothetical protein